MSSRTVTNICIILSTALCLFANIFTVYIVSSPSSVTPKSNKTCQGVIHTVMGSGCFHHEGNENRSYFLLNGTKFECMRLNDSILSIEDSKLSNKYTRGSFILNLCRPYINTNKMRTNFTDTKVVSKTIPQDAMNIYSKPIDIFQSDIYKIQLFRLKQDRNNKWKFTDTSAAILKDFEKCSTTGHSKKINEWNLMEEVLMINKSLLKKYNIVIGREQGNDEDIRNQILLHSKSQKNTKLDFLLQFFEREASLDSFIDLKLFEVRFFIRETSKEL